MIALAIAGAERGFRARAAPLGCGVRAARSRRRCSNSHTFFWGAFGWEAGNGGWSWGRSAPGGCTRASSSRHGRPGCGRAWEAAIGSVGDRWGLVSGKDGWRLFLARPADMLTPPPGEDDGYRTRADGGGESMARGRQPSRLLSKVIPSETCPSCEQGPSKKDADLSENDRKHALRLKRLSAPKGRQTVARGASPWFDLSQPIQP